MNNICLVTGASGFIGSALIKQIAESRKNELRVVVRGAYRTLPAMCTQNRDVSVVGDIHAKTDWRNALSGVDAVIHTAARAHVLKESEQVPAAAFRKVNVDGSINLAEQAVLANVRRFIFISSIGVNGSQTFEHLFSASDIPDPQEPYAQSKLEAENALREVFSGTQTQLVIIRPPLVYGPNAPGNFLRLLRLAASGFPLPLGAIHNKRSFVALDNLIDLLITCIDHPAAANQIFLVSDDDDISTTELLKRIAVAMGKEVRLVPVPERILQAAAHFVGKPGIAQRLCGSLQVDISKTKEVLGWEPPVTVDQALRQTVSCFLQNQFRK